MKDTICLITGIVGGFIATLLGGWDSALATLVVFMGIDFVTGILLLQRWSCSWVSIL